MDSIKPHGVTKKKKKRQEENNSITGKHGKGITRPEILENFLKKKQQLNLFVKNKTKNPQTTGSKEFPDRRVALGLSKLVCS